MPASFNFPHTGKLLSLSFILFAGWFADAAVPVTDYPAAGPVGLLTFFGSLNAAVPFLLDLFRIPADTFQLFVATGVDQLALRHAGGGRSHVAVALLGALRDCRRDPVRPRRSCATSWSRRPFRGGARRRLGCRSRRCCARVRARQVVYGRRTCLRSPSEGAVVGAAAEASDGSGRDRAGGHPRPRHPARGFCCQRAALRLHERARRSWSASTSSSPTCSPRTRRQARIRPDGARRDWSMPCTSGRCDTAHRRASP